MRIRGLVVACAALLAAPVARADDFFKLSPGPLATAHEELDNHDSCTKCHELGKGVTDFLCLDCHQHRPLRDAIKKKMGLHAGFKDPCRKCHADHKGRDALIVDWSAVGGRQSFEHKRTGFDLTGLHEKVACTACHKRRLKSGRTSFTDVEPDCDGCHKNPHQFTKRDLREACSKCHKAGIAKKLKPSDLFFDHGERTGFALTGKHGEADCLKCHEKANMATPKGGARSCASCHQRDNPHGRAYARVKCDDCHAAGKAFKEPTFDHDKTGFPLRAQHKTKKCGNCHKKPKVKPDPACRSCHQDPHKTRFDAFQCDNCHGLGGSKKVKFAHAKRTEFELTGKHTRLECRSCHRGKNPRAFERFETKECMKCHAHVNAHNGEFKDKPCLTCHKEGGSNDLKFNHQKDARFATTGFHLELEQTGQCKKCHPKNQFRTGKLRCVDCHKDSHQGELGEECVRCHLPDVHFKEIVFDHDVIAAFPLENKHKETKCEKCHENRHYKTGKLACIDCHADDDPHQTKLGKDCARCHIPTKGAPKFNHEQMTAFVRDGKHLDAKCFGCHRSSFPDKAPPQIGWVKSLPAEEKLDRTFPVIGKVCADCHFDRHNGDYGKACDSCHNTSGFGSASRAVHDTGAFRLQGTHDLLACQRCHQPNRPLAGLGAMCGECHRTDDVHNNALGEMCGRCHSQIDWRPARFNHATVGFALRGAHATARCTDCHSIGVYAGTPRECARCHEPAARQVPDPVHDPAVFTDCQNCHVEVSFAPARRYHPWFTLVGTHSVARCSACHLNATYVGTPQDCASCHRAAYVDPTNRPNHVAAGFAEQCELCHTPLGWPGARYQHKTFVMRGIHVALTCDRCHAGENYDGAFNSMIRGWDCASCHGIGGPDPRRPADHDVKGYPQTCDLCHSEAAWLPARDPR